MSVKFGQDSAAEVLQETKYVPGTVLRHRTLNRYLRVLQPWSPVTGSVYVRNSDGAGFELDNKARWLTRKHLTRTYVVYYQPGGQA